MSKVAFTPGKLGKVKTRGKGNRKSIPSTATGSQARYIKTRLEFALIYPKEKLNEVAQPENESQVGKKR